MASYLAFFSFKVTDHNLLSALWVSNSEGEAADAKEKSLRFFVYLNQLKKCWKQTAEENENWDLLL